MTASDPALPDIKAPETAVAPPARVSEKGQKIIARALEIKRSKRQAHRRRIRASNTKG